MGCDDDGTGPGPRMTTRQINDWHEAYEQGKREAVPEGCVVVTPDEQEALRALYSRWANEQGKYADLATHPLVAALPLWAVTE